MISKAATADQYYDEINPDQKPAMDKIRKVVKKNLPKGFIETIDYGMPGWSVPHKLYPAGYHCKPEIPLPFMGVAAQKGSINFYHMGVYADPKLLKWFQDEYAKRVPGKLDMGKSCIRFKKYEQIPLDLLGELASKMTPDQWIELYEKSFRDARKKKK